MVKLKNRIIMKKMRITKWLLCAVLGVVLTNCSNEEGTEKFYFSTLQFNVSVNVPNDATRASLNRKTWEKGDRIAMAIDGEETNVAFLEYIGNGDWTVSQLNENTHFSGTSGKLSAVYAENLDYQMGNVKTGGDILYTQSGTYEIRDNIARIRLSMSERPVSRIAIVGLNSSYWLENIEECTLLKSLVSMEWDTSVKSEGENNKNVYGDTCVFYGILSPDNSGNTTISLINADGATHKRIYEGKQVKKGDYVILNGPGTDENSLWKSDVPVKGIKAVKNNIELWIGEKGNIQDLYTILPDDAVNKRVNASSSNTNVINVNNNETYEAVEKGSASMTITTEDGGYSCKVGVMVKSVADYVKLQFWGVGQVIENSEFWYKTIYKVTNNSPVEIKLLTLAGVDITSYGNLATEKEIEIELYSKTGYINGSVKLVFSHQGKTYTISN